MILDTSALLAIAWDEPERARFEDLIEADPVRRMSAASALEGAIVMMRRAGRGGAAQALARLHDLLGELGIEVEPVTSDQVRLAELAYQTYSKGWHPAGLNFGDCFVYALAKATGEPQGRRLRQDGPTGRP
jgi:ribonuclease VapC